jgi:uncharacterized membrane protein
MKVVGRSILRFFLVGVVAVLPLVITVGVVAWVSGILARWFGRGTPVGQAIAAIGLPVGGETFAYIVGWVLVLAVIFGLGLLVEMGARRFLVDKIDALALRIPVLGGVYGTVRQFAELMDTKDKADLRGMSVVYVIFGGERGAAFLALLPTPERFRIGELDYHAVVIPSAPVPVGGSLIFVPAASVLMANVSMEAFMSVYVSMGVTGPQFLAKSDEAPDSERSLS